MADGADTQDCPYTEREGKQDIPMGNADRYSMGEGGVAMTPALQKEYIITDDQLVKAVALTDWYNIAALCKEIRSRPTPSPILMRECFGNYEDCPCDDECIVSEYCKKYHEDHEKNSCGMTESQCVFVQGYQKEHDAFIVAQARDKTLTDVIAILNERAMIDENNQYYLWLEDAECAVGSLRTEAHK